MGTLTINIQDNQRLSLHCVEEITLTPTMEFLDPTDPDWTRMLIIKTRHGTIELELHSDESRGNLDTHLLSEKKQ